MSIEDIIISKKIFNKETENPFNTNNGQNVVSISESEQSRNIREGSLIAFQYTQTNPTGGAFGTAYTPTTGYYGTLQKAIVSTNGSTPVPCSIRITTGITGDSQKEIVQVVSSSTPLILDLPVKMGTGGKLEYRVLTGYSITGVLLCGGLVIEKPIV